MRRGLIAWSRAELPEAALAARVAKTRAALRAAGLDALVAYTNNTRTAAVSWLSGFVPYWSEGVLMLPPEGDPVLVVALTKRVASWIATTSKVAEVVSTPRFGREAGRRLVAAGAKRIAVVERDAIPAGVVAELAEAGAALEDASLLFAGLRAVPDAAELALAAKAGAIAAAALARADGATDANAAVAAVEQSARLAGAEEAYIAIAPDLARDTRLRRLDGPERLGPRHALRATVAYKGSWVRMTRTLAPEAARGAELFAAAVAALPRSDGLAALASWLVEGCRLAQPLEPLMGSNIAGGAPLAAGSLVSVQARLEVEGAPVLLGAPALIGSPSGLLVAPVF